MKKWSLNSWTKYPAKHLPVYQDKKELDLVLSKIKKYPPLVFAGESRSLKKALAEVAEGKAFLFKEEIVLKVLLNFIQIILEIHLRFFYRCH